MYGVCIRWAMSSGRNVDRGCYWWDDMTEARWIYCCAVCRCDVRCCAVCSCGVCCCGVYYYSVYCRAHVTVVYVVVVYVAAA